MSCAIRRINKDTDIPPDITLRPFRKKPVVVLAAQMNEEFEVETIEGVMRGRPGDWLIRGISGEYYPCQNDIFLATYEEAG